MGDEPSDEALVVVGVPFCQFVGSKAENFLDCLVCLYPLATC